jgi:hypothetical protein
MGCDIIQNGAIGDSAPTLSPSRLVLRSSRCLRSRPRSDRGPRSRRCSRRRSRPPAAPGATTHSFPPCRPRRRSARVLPRRCSRKPPLSHPVLTRRPPRRRDSALSPNHDGVSPCRPPYLPRHPPTLAAEPTPHGPRSRAERTKNMREGTRRGARARRMNGPDWAWECQCRWAWALGMSFPTTSNSREAWTWSSKRRAPRRSEVERSEKNDTSYEHLGGCFFGIVLYFAA